MLFTFCVPVWHHATRKQSFEMSPFTTGDVIMETSPVLFVHSSWTRRVLSSLVHKKKKKQAYMETESREHLFFFLHRQKLKIRHAHINNNTAETLSVESYPAVRHSGSPDKSGQRAAFTWFKWLVWLRHFDLVLCVMLDWRLTGEWVRAGEQTQWRETWSDTKTKSSRGFLVNTNTDKQANLMITMLLCSWFTRDSWF